jgi:hypothetical protein
MSNNIFLKIKNTYSFKWILGIFFRKFDIGLAMNVMDRMTQIFNMLNIPN